MKLNVKRIIAPVLSATLVLSSIPFSSVTAYAEMGDIDYAKETFDKGTAVSYSTNNRTYTKITTAEINLAKIISSKDVTIYLKDAADQISDFEIPARPKAPTVKYDGINDTVKVDNGAIDNGYEVKVGTGAWVTGTNDPTDYQLADFKAGASIQVRAKSDSNDFKSSIKTYTMPKRPAAPSASLDYKTGILKGSAKMKYIVVDAAGFTTPDPKDYDSLDGIAFTGSTEDLSDVLTATRSSAKKIVVWTDKTATAPASLPKIISVSQRTTATPVSVNDFSYVPLKDMFMTSKTNYEYSTNSGKTYVSFAKTGVSVKSIIPTTGTRTILVREKATVSKLASVPYEITVKAREAHGLTLSFDTKDPNVVTLNGDTDANQYSIDGGVVWKTWNNAAATSVFGNTLNRGKTLKLRIAGTGYNSGELSPASTEASIVIPKTQARAPLATVDYKKEVIAGVKNTMEYKLGDGAWTAVTGTTIEAVPNDAGGTNKVYTIRYKNTGTTVASAEAKVVIKPRPATPTITAAQKLVYDETYNKVFASLSGVNATMEFKKTTDSAWTKYSETTFKAKYSSSASVAKDQAFEMQVRLAPTASQYASASVTVAPPTPTKAQSLEAAFTAASTAIYGLTLSTATATDVLAAAKNVITNPGITVTWSETFSNASSSGKILLNYAVVKKTRLIALYGSSSVEDLDVKVEPGDAEGQVKITAVGATHYTRTTEEVTGVTSSTAPLSDILTVTSGKGTLTTGDSKTAKIGEWLTVYTVAGGKLVAFKSVKLVAKDIKTADAPAYVANYADEKTTVNVAITDEYTTVSANYEGEWTTGTGIAKATLTPGKNIYFRKKATGDNPPGTVQTLVVAARPAAPKTVSISYSLQKLNAYVNADMEYNTDGTSTYTQQDLAVPANLIALIPATGEPAVTLLVRNRATSTAFASLPADLGKLAPVAPAPAYFVDYTTEKTTAAVPTTVEYNTTSATHTGVWTTGVGATLALNPGAVAKSIYIRTKATNTGFSSAVQTLAVPARPTAPSAAPAVSYFNESIKSGYLPASQEYSLDGGVNFIAGDLTVKDSLKNIIPTTGSPKIVYVRNKAVTIGTKAFASATTDFTLGVRPAAPAADRITIAAASDGVGKEGETVLTGVQTIHEYAITKATVELTSGIALQPSGDTIIPWTDTVAGSLTGVTGIKVLPGYKLWYRVKAVDSDAPTGEARVYAFKNTDILIRPLATVVKKSGSNDATAIPIVSSMSEIKYAAVSPGTDTIAEFLKKVGYGMTAAEAGAALGSTFTDGVSIYNTTNNDKYIVAIELKDGKLVSLGKTTNALSFVSLVPNSEGIADDNTIKGLTNGSSYILSNGSNWFGVKADGTLNTAAPLTDAGMLTAITGAANLSGVTAIASSLAGDKTYNVVKVVTVADGTVYTVGAPSGLNHVRVDSTGQLYLIGKAGGGYEVAKLTTAILPLSKLMAGDTFKLATGNVLSEISINGSNSVSLGGYVLTQPTTINQNSTGMLTVGDVGKTAASDILTLGGTGSGPVTIGTVADGLNITNTGNGNITTTGAVVTNVTINTGAESAAGGLIKLAAVAGDITTSGAGTRPVMTSTAKNLVMGGARNVIVGGNISTKTSTSSPLTGKLVTDIGDIDLKTLDLTAAALTIEHNSTGTLATGAVTGTNALTVSGFGSGTVTVGAVGGSITVSNTGSAIVGVAAVTGASTVSGTGTGAVTIASTAGITASGSRNVGVTNASGIVVASGTGAGTVTVGGAASDVTVSGTGTGKVTVASATGNILASGDRDLKVTGAVGGTVTVSGITGNGTVDTGAVTGAVSVTGNGTGKVKLASTVAAPVIVEGSREFEVGGVGGALTIGNGDGVVKVGAITGTGAVGISGTGAGAVTLASTATGNATTISGSRPVTVTGAVVGSLAITAGSGIVNTGAVTGAVTISGNGTGKVTLASTVVTTGTVNVSGDRELQVGAVGGTLTVGAGAGAVTTGAVTGAVTLSDLVGTGAVTLASAAAAVSVDGTRPIEITGLAADNVTLAGSGAVELAAVTKDLTISEARSIALDANVSGITKVSAGYTGTADLGTHAGAGTPANLVIDGAIGAGGKVSFTGNTRTSFKMTAAGLDTTGTVVAGSPTPAGGTPTIKTDGSAVLTIAVNGNTVAGAKFSKTFTTPANKVAVQCDTTTPANIASVTITPGQ